MSLVKQFRIIVMERAEKKVNDVYRTMVENAPVYTGELKKSIRIERTGKYSWFIGPHTDHDYWAEHGNHANHPDGYIYAKALIGKKGAKALAFTTNKGKKVVTSRVRPHKGSKFVEKTYKQHK